MSTEVTIHDADSFADAMGRIRSDTDSTNWALFGHVEEDPNLLCFVESGSDGLEEMISHLMDSQIQYALVRLEETVDMSTTIKFVYIRWNGSNVPFVKRGKFGVVHGSIEKEFTPYHCSIEVDSQDELTEEIVMTKLQEQSGTKSKVLEATVAKTRPERGFTSGTTTKLDSTGAAPTQPSRATKIGKMGNSYTGMTGMAKSSGGVRTPEKVVDTIKAVRNDNDDTTWCTIGYEEDDPKKPLEVKNHGTDIEEFPEQFSQANIVLYGLVRVADVVDGINTVKFAYIQWVGEEVKPMAKAKVSTHKGALENQFKPFHVAIFATTSSEVTMRIINDKVGCASGSKSNIKT